MPLDGAQMEELTFLIREYNQSLVAETQAGKAKKDASANILKLLKVGQVHDIEVTGCRVQAIPTMSQRRISVTEAEAILPADLFQQLVKGGTPSGVRADIRPIRGR